MESTNQFNIPKLEQQHYVDQLMFLEDQLQGSLQIPYVPPLPSLDTNYWTCNNLQNNTCNSLTEYQSPLTPQTNFINNENNFQALENINFEDADFQIWNECLPLLEDAWLSQIPPNNTTIPCTFDNPYPNPNPNPITISNPNNPTHFDQFELNDQYFLLNNTNLNDFVNDQFSTMVITEGDIVQRFLENDDHMTRESKEIKPINIKVPKIESIQFEEVRKYFDMPISKAAKELNVGLTVFKKRCRELNIMRWPHRKIKSLESLISNVKDMGMMELVQELEEHKRNLQSVPGLELTQATKKLRQACFKANYKKRRAAVLALSQ